MKKYYLFLLSILFLHLNAWAASPWLPPAGRFDLALGLSQESYDALWKGSLKTQLPATAKLKFGYIGYVFGITDMLATDLLTGYSRTSWPAGTRQNLGGRIDTDIGVLVRILDETATKKFYIPTLTARFGGTIKGDYLLATPANLQSPGNGVNGEQASVLVGKILPQHFSIFGEIGYRFRGFPVPDAYFGNVGILQTPREHWSWSVYFQRYSAISGINIGEPPFTGQIGKFGFQATQERTSYLNGSIIYTFKGGQSLAFVYGQAISGKNSAVTKVASLLLTLPIQIFEKNKNK